MREYQCDVVVAGGGTAGIAAALAASRLGAKVILIERYGFLGGNATNAQVSAFCGFYTRGQQPDLVIGGIGQEVLQKLTERGVDVTAHPSPSTGNSNVKFDPEMLKIIFDELVEESEVELFLHTNLVDVTKESNRITSVCCADDEGMFTIHAASFIDATGNASLVHFAGIPTTWGNEDGQSQQVSTVFRIGNLPKREIANQEVEVSIQKAKAAGLAGLQKEKGMIIKRPNEDFGFCTIASTNLDDLSAAEATRAEVALRKQMHAYLEAFRTYIPGCEDIQLTSSGPFMGLRETRHILAETTLEGRNILEAEKRTDSIGRAAWSPEIHSKDANVQYIHIPDNEYASIPLGSLKVAAAENVWACGRVIGADSLAFASVRVMGTGFVTGQAAGVAAALSLTGTAELDNIQSTLIEQGALL